jgi:TctA family transporter
MMEEFLRRAMLLSKGDPTVLVTRPISAVMLILAVGLLVLVLSPTISKRREEAFQEESA